MKRKNLTMKKLSAVLISATMMLNGGDCPKTKLGSHP